MGGGDAAAGLIIPRFFFFILLVISLTGQGAGRAHAVAGDLDPAFGDGGVSIPPITGVSLVSLRALAIQDDGKIVGLGTCQNLAHTDNDFLVFRLLPGGGLDTGFGTGGWATVDFTTGDMPGDLVIQSDGKIVVVGATAPGLNRWGVLARFSATGNLDAGFGDQGKVIMSNSFQSAWWAVTLQVDNKIVVAGTKDTKFTVARFTTAGSLDTTFDSDGMATLATSGTSHAADVLIDGDARIVAGGYVDNSATDEDLLVARFNSNGSPHTSFGSAGVFTLDFDSGSWDYGIGLALDATGRIVLAGKSAFTSISSGEVATVVRLTSGGVLDTTFGTGGKAYYVADNPMNTTGMLLDPTGRPVLAGYFSFTGSGPYDGQSWLVRFTADGTVDRGFGVEGLKAVSHGAQCDFWGGACLDARDRLLCVGESDDQGMVTRHQSDDHTERWGTTWWWSDDAARQDAYLLDTGQLTIKAAAMQDIWNCERRKAPMFVRNLPAAKHWAVQTAVQVPNQKQDTFAGLVIWNGAESGSAVYALYVGLRNMLGQTYISAQGSIPEQCAETLANLSYGQDLVVVKIVRAGNDYTFFGAAPFTPWYDMGTITTTAEFRKVGLMGKTWHASNDLEASFGFFGMILPGAASSLDLLLSP
jgi:uncharacterized delta-60 repeat protein